MGLLLLAGFTDVESCQTILKQRDGVYLEDADGWIHGVVNLDGSSGTLYDRSRNTLVQFNVLEADDDGTWAATPDWTEIELEPTDPVGNVSQQVWFPDSCPEPGSTFPVGQEQGGLFLGETPCTATIPSVIPAFTPGDTVAATRCTRGVSQPGIINTGEGVAVEIGVPGDPVILCAATAVLTDLGTWTVAEQSCREENCIDFGQPTIGIGTIYLCGYSYAPGGDPVDTCTGNEPPPGPYKIRFDRLPN